MSQLFAEKENDRVTPATAGAMHLQSCISTAPGKWELGRRSGAGLSIEFCYLLSCAWKKKAQEIAEIEVETGEGARTMYSFPYLHIAPCIPKAEKLTL